MYNLYIMLIFTLTALCMTSAMTNLLLYPVKLYVKIIIFTYIIFCQMYLSPIYQQGATIICVAGIIFLLFLNKKYILQNAIFSLAGYIFYVLVDHMLLVPLYAIGITIDTISKYPVYDIIFVLSLTIITVILSLLLGRLLRNRFKSFFVSFSKGIQYWLLIESSMCVLVFIYNIILGDIKGYTTDVIFRNGLLFTFFFIILLFVFLSGTFIILKHNNSQQTKAEEEDMILHFNNLEDIYQEMRTLKHDYKNILSTVAIVDESDIDNIETYFKTEIIPEYTKMVNKNEYFKKSLKNKINNTNIKQTSA